MDGAYDELSDASDYLTLAKRQGEETLLDEDLGEEEIQDELLPISVQAAVVQELLGKKEEAAEEYRAALGLKNTSDAAAQAVAANNLAAMVGPRGKGVERLFTPPQPPQSRASTRPFQNPFTTNGEHVFPSVKP